MLNYLRVPKLNQLRQLNSWPHRTVEEREDYHIISCGEIKPSFNFHDIVAENRGHTHVTVQYVAMWNQTLYLLQMMIDLALAEPCANSASCFLMSSLIDSSTQLNGAAMTQ